MRTRNSSIRDTHTHTHTTHAPCMQVYTHTQHMHLVCMQVYTHTQHVHLTHTHNTCMHLVCRSTHTHNTCTLHTHTTRAPYMYAGRHSPRLQQPNTNPGCMPTHSTTVRQSGGNKEEMMITKSCIRVRHTLE